MEIKEDDIWMPAEHYESLVNDANRCSSLEFDLKKAKDKVNYYEKVLGDVCRLAENHLDKEIWTGNLHSELREVFEMFAPVLDKMAEQKRLIDELSEEVHL